MEAELQAVLVGGVFWRAGGQEGRGDRRSRCRGNIQEGVAADAGGCRVAEGCGRGDAGEVDAQREPRLLQGLLWHGKRLQLLLTVGHVGVLAASADTVKACLETTAVRDYIHSWGALLKNCLQRANVK